MAQRPRSWSRARRSVGEALPALAQPVREELRHGPAELRGIFHHGFHERPRIAAALALPQKLNLVGEQAPVLEAPLVAERGERRAQAGERAARLPQPVELRVDPGERLIPRSLDPAADPVQRRGAGHEGGHGAIVGQELRAVGVGVEVLVRGESHELLRVDSLALGERQRLLVGKEEAVREAGPDRVAHVALPEHAAQGRVVLLVGVLGGLAHGEHPAHADDHAPGLLRERGALGIEEAERLRRPERAEEGVEQRELVLALLDPVRLDLLAAAAADVGLAVWHPTDLQALGDPDLAVLRVPLDLLAKHPAERNAGSGVRRLHVASGREVAVGLDVELRVRVRHRPREREGRHERDALAHTGREIGAVELVEAPAGATRLHIVSPTLADAGQDEAARVVQRPGTHLPGPAPVVPGDADGDVVQRQASGTGGETCHDEPPSAAFFRPAGGCFQSSALAPDTSRRSRNAPMSSISMNAIDPCGCPCVSKICLLCASLRGQ